MRKAPCFIVCFFSLAMLACSPRSTVLAIAVSSIPKTTRNIDIALTIDGKSYAADPPFAYDQSRGASTVLTGIEIPWQFSDRLLGIDIAARDDKCTLAHFSSATAAIEPGTYTVSAPLQALENDDLINDLFATFSSTADDVWAGGANQSLAHWDGCYWTRGNVDMELGGTISRIYAHPRIGSWIVGGEGLVMHYDAALKIWHVLDEPAKLFPGKSALFQDITYLNGSANEVLIVGSQGGGMPSCFAVRGTQVGGNYTWKLASEVCDALSPATTVGCNGCRFYPSRMKSFDKGGLVIGGTSGALDVSMNMVYQGAFVRFADATLTNPDGRLIAQIAGVPNQAVMPWGVDLGDFFLGGARLTRVTGTGGATVITPQTNFYTDGTNAYAISGMWGTSMSDFWIVGVHTQTRFSRLHHVLDPVNVNSSNYVSIGSYQLNNVHGSAPGDVWFIGNGGLRAHYDGKSFAVTRDL